MKIRYGRTGFVITIRRTAFPFPWARREYGYKLIRGYYARRGKPELAEETILCLEGAWKLRA